MKRHNKSKNSGEPLNYWQSTADMMSALLLILLLVIMLLLLYIIQIPEEDYIDLYPGSSSSVAGSYEDGGWGGDEEGGYEEPDDDGGGGWDGGGGGGDDQGDGEEDYEFPVAGGGTGEASGYGKTAVYVMVIDAETEATIKEAGIQFELYTTDGAMQFLNTYYPRRIEYRKYETTAEGVFYLPEKILQDHYYFHELTEPEGYDSAGNIEFWANEDRDWDEPLVVVVPLMPSKNVIRIQMTDADTNQPVSGGVYDVIAAEDIITKDGTLRYSAGQTVDRIECNENGYGESIELYLGEYTLVQTDAPRYYASDLEERDFTVEKKEDGLLAPIHKITCEKTTVTVQVSDELYPSEGLGNISFRLTQGGVGTTMVSTDENGLLVLTDLEKNTTYRLRQLESADQYRFSDADFVFSVSADGRVEEEAQKSYVITNRIIRAEISVVDRVLRSHVSDFNVALYDSQDQLVGVWDSTALARSLEGLEPGIYYLVLDGKTESRRAIEIQDTAEIQIINVPVWTMAGVGVLGLVVALALALAAFLIRRRQRRGPSDLPPPSVELIAAVSRAGAAQSAAAPAPEADAGESQPETIPGVEPETEQPADTEPANTEPAPEAEAVRTETTPEAEPAKAETVPETAPAQPTTTSEAESAQTEAAPKAEPASAEPASEAESAKAETTSEAEPAEAETVPEAAPAQPVTTSEAESAQTEPAPEAEPASTEPASEAESIKAETTPEAEPARAETAPEFKPGDLPASTERTETRRPRGGSHAKPRRSWWGRNRRDTK